jgi:hypothetical protein
MLDDEIMDCLAKFGDADRVIAEVWNPNGYSV